MTWRGTVIDLESVQLMLVLSPVLCTVVRLGSAELGSYYTLNVKESEVVDQCEI